MEIQKKKKNNKKKNRSIKDDPNVASSENVLDILRLMLGNIEKVKEVDLWLLYMKLPCSAFAPLLIIALDSYSNRCRDGVPLSKMDHDMITELCHVLPWKLFAHILSYKTLLPLLKSTSYETSAKSKVECIPVQTSAESEGECIPVQISAESEEEWTYPVEDNAELDEEWTPGQLKEAAERCEICLGNGQHSGFHGYDCSYLVSQLGGTVGPDYWAVCTDCGNSDYTQIVMECVL